MRRVATLVALALVAVACTEAKGPVAVSPSPSPAGSPVEVVTGSTTAAQAMKDLCIPADVEADPVTKVPTPPSIVEVEDQVEAVRDLRYERPVNVEPISEEMDRRLRKYFDAYYPEEYYDRSERGRRSGRSPGRRLPRGPGRVPAGPGAGLLQLAERGARLHGDANLTRIEQFVLAHELTHAIDDQHFDLDRLDDMAIACQDEPLEAAIGPSRERESLRHPGDPSVPQPHRG